MRVKNWRIVTVGGAMIALAGVFFLVMLSVASQSSDPAALMQIVGTTAGVVCGIAVAMIAVGLIGKKA